jgi:hypothetical protein
LVPIFVLIKAMPRTFGVLLGLHKIWDSGAARRGIGEKK